MGSFVKGEIVIIPFPYSDQSGSKRRPALIIKPLQGDDIILCQITANQYSDNTAILIKQNDLSNGTLKNESYVRIGRLFTADENTIVGSIGTLSRNKFQQIIKSLIGLIQS